MIKLSYYLKLTDLTQALEFFFIRDCITSQNCFAFSIKWLPVPLRYVIT
jgi:hypothetical protein